MRSLFIAALVACSLLTSGTQAAAKPDDHRYVNSEYGYSITIPPGREANLTPPPVPQHGLEIKLSPCGKMWIDGAYDAQFMGSSNAALKELASDEALPFHPQPMRLSGLAASRIDHTSGNKVRMRVVAFRPQPEGVGIIYTLGLNTDARHAQSDRVTFDTVLKSFRTRKLPH